MNTMENQKFEKLFTPIKFGPVEIKNRFIVSPMVMNFCTTDGMCTERFAAYHEEKAKGGWGLIITEDFAISPRGKGYDYLPGLWKDEQIPGFKNMTDRVHKHGAKIYAQIYHCGRQTNSKITGFPVEAPSAIECPNLREIPRELTTAEVKEIVTMFGDAALRAKKAGFDGVMIHAAHGYLINEFLSSYSNKRIDEYGGCFTNRVRFLLEIIADIRSKVGNDFGVDIKLSGQERVPEGMTIVDTMTVARLVEAAGVNSINISSGVYATGYTQVQPAVYGHGWLLDDAYAVKQVVNIPVTVIGRVNDAMYAETILKTGKVDAVYMGRASLADPHMPNKLKAGDLEDIVRCTACLQGCVNNLGKRNPAQCVVNPRMGFESEYDLRPVAECDRKTVWVAGGGPGGAEAAIVAAEKGHKVTLFEASNHLGGNFKAAAVAPYKGELTTFMSWQRHRLEKLGVHVHMNTELTAAMVKEGKPDKVIVATGSEVARPPIAGLDLPFVHTAVEALYGQCVADGKIAVIGGGLVGGECANFLASHDNAVSIFEYLPDVIIEEPDSLKHFVKRDFREHDVDIHVSTKVVSINEDKSITYENAEEGAVTTKPFDAVLIATGLRSVNTLEAELKAEGVDVVSIGDAHKASDGYAAIRSGYETALNI